MTRHALSVAAAVLAQAGLVHLAQAQHVRTLESSRILRDSAPVTVHLALGTGTLSVGASDAPFLYRSITRFGDTYTAPTSTWNAAQRTLTLNAGQRGATAAPRTGDGTTDDVTQDWRVQLTRRAPMELTIDAAAAEAMLDMTGLPLRRFALNTNAATATLRFDAPNPEPMSVLDAEVGAGGLKVIGLGNAGASELRIHGDVGDLSLDLSGRWQRDLQMLVSTAVGSISITAPPTIGIELTSGGLLARHRLDGTFTKRGDTWRSAGFETAPVKVRILVKSILGKVTLIQR